jgi:hypothetical protein
MRAMEGALYIERGLRRAPSLEIRTNFLLATEDKPKTCAIVSLLRSSDSFEPRSQGKRNRPNEGLQKEKRARSAAKRSEMRAKRLLQGLQQIRQKPVAQSAKIVL